MYGLGEEEEDEEEYLRIPYAFGDAPKFAKILPRTEFKRLQEALDRTRRARVDQAFTLVVVVVVTKSGFRTRRCASSQRGICYIQSSAHLLVYASYATVIRLTFSNFSLKDNGCASCVNVYPFRQC